MNSIVQRQKLGGSQSGSGGTGATRLRSVSQSQVRDFRTPPPQQMRKLSTSSLSSTGTNNNNSNNRLIGNGGRYSNTSILIRLLDYVTRVLLHWKRTEYFQLHLNLAANCLMLMGRQILAAIDLTLNLQQLSKINYYPLYLYRLKGMMIVLYIHRYHRHYRHRQIHQQLTWSNHPSLSCHKRSHLQYQQFLEVYSLGGQ